MSNRVFESTCSHAQQLTQPQCQQKEAGVAPSHSAEPNKDQRSGMESENEGSDALIIPF